MANIRKWFEAWEEKWGEPIEAMVVGEHYDRAYDDKPETDENVVLGREAGLAKVDQEYENDFGGADCFPCYAWTASRIFFIDEYDGATGPNWVPRHPTALAPEFSGQTD